jgi:hypothetical protein
MISIFSDAVRLTRRPPRHDPSDFFKNAIAKRDLGHHLLELSVLRAQVPDLITGGFANRVPCQLLLARFEETLAPPIVKIGSDALSVAQIGDTLLATETVEYDPDLFFGGKSAARLSTDLTHCGFAGLLLSCRHKDSILGDDVPVMCLLD